MTSRTDPRCEVAVRLPFHSESLLAYLGARAMEGVERVHGSTYDRVVSWKGRLGVATVDLTDSSTTGLASVRCGVDGAGSWIADRFTSVLDAHTDVRPIEGHLKRDPRLRDIVLAQTGVRIPGAMSAFELTVRAVLGQQISVAGATRLASRLAAQFGGVLDLPCSSLRVAFPEPERLIDADIEQLGIPSTRAEAIRQVARDLLSGRLVLRRGERIDEVYQQLLSIRGIGPWTAGYVTLRALGDGNALLAGDLGVRQALGTAGVPATAAAVASSARSWEPFRGYATMHIWTKLLLAQRTTSKQSPTRI